MFKKRKKHDIPDIAIIGYLPADSNGSVEVYVQTDDNGGVPHFHVRKHGKKGKLEWETCIKYTEALYFLHDSYKDKLPDKNISKALDEMLKTENPNDHRTYWQTAIVAWNNNNSSVEVPFDLPQPDYTLL